MFAFRWNSSAEGRARASVRDKRHIPWRPRLLRGLVTASRAARRCLYASGSQARPLRVPIAIHVHVARLSALEPPPSDVRHITKPLHSAGEFLVRETERVDNTHPLDAIFSGTLEQMEDRWAGTAVRGNDGAWHIVRGDYGPLKSTFFL